MNKSILKRKLPFYAIGLLMVLVLVAAGCVHGPIRTLTEDQLDEDYKSVVFLHLRAIDRIGAVALLFDRSGAASGETGSTPLFLINTTEGLSALRTEQTEKWALRDGSYYRDIVYYAEVRPGELGFSSIRFFTGSEFTSTICPPGFINCSTTTTFYIDFPIKKSCFINPGELVYLGMFDIEIINKIKDRYNYNLQMNTGKADFENDLKSFKSKFPMLYEKFKDKTEIASWTGLENYAAVSSKPIKETNIPSFEGYVTSLRFFESGYEVLPYEKRNYRNEFTQAEVRYINWELNLRHPALGRRIDYDIEAIYRRADGSVIAQQSKSSYMEADWKYPYTSNGWGNKNAGKAWLVGDYTVEIYAGGKKIASGSFRIK